MVNFVVLAVVAMALIACVQDNQALLERYEREREAEAAPWRGRLSTL